ILGSTREARSESAAVDLILTSAPANPLCWWAILVNKNKEHFEYRRGTYSVAPDWISPKQCQMERLMGGALAWVEPGTDLSPNLHWYQSIQGQTDQLESLAKQDCVATAALRFMRAPYVIQSEEKMPTGITDVRFDRGHSQKESWTTIALK